MQPELTIQIEVPRPQPHPKPAASRGRVPRISRLIALAIRCDDLIRSRVLHDYTDLAKLGGITKPRVTQLMNLLHLAPDIQEHLLFLPRQCGQRDSITERHLRPVVQLVDWVEQRQLFSCLFPDSSACKREQRACIRAAEE
jgi:hypothetical protein